MIVFIASVNVCKSFHIACDHKEGDFGFGELKTCEPRLFDTHAHKFVESVISWPLNRPVSQIQQLYVLRGNSVFFPGNLHKFFPNLEVVKIFSSRLKFIDNYDFRFLMTLKYLDLEQNEIEVLQSDLFQFNLLLIKVNFRKNKLKFIGARLLEPLKHLTTARFEENTCISDGAERADKMLELQRSIEINCGPNEFLVQKNAEFIKQVVNFNYTIGDLTLKVTMLEKNSKHLNESFINCENESESLSETKFKVEMKLRRESMALRKAENELKIATQSNDDLTIENVKLNNELKREKMKIPDRFPVEKYNFTGNCQSGEVETFKLKFENSRFSKENQLLKSFKDEIEREWRSVTLNCEFVLWSSYTCQVSSLKIRTDDTEIVKVDGKHENRKSNFDVRTFVISSQDVRTTFLPINIGSIFPRLGHLFAQNSKIVFIKRRNFDNLLNLDTLMLDHNQIENIPKETFNDLENLEKIDLSHNRVIILDRNLFKTLKKLKILMISDNQIENLSANLLKFNLKLEIIAMENNQIKFIGNMLMKTLSNLKFVNFQENVCINGDFSGQSLQYIDSRASTHCTPPTDIYCKFEQNSCKVVDLAIENENTKIMEIIGNLPRGKSLIDVITLSIIDQNVLHFPHGFGKFMKNLDKIYVKNSKLTAVDDNDFDDMNQLVQLFLGDNEIQTVSEDALQKVKSSIEVIDLSSNQIIQFDGKTFKNLLKLKILKLDRNRIEKLNSNLLVDQINLEEFYVNGNKLKSIGPYIMNNLRKLKLADFSSNVCIDSKFPLMQMQVLKLKILEQCQ